jgi:hypothetical protein
MKTTSSPGGDLDSGGTLPSEPMSISSSRHPPPFPKAFSAQVASSLQKTKTDTKSGFFPHKFSLDESFNSLKDDTKKSDWIKNLIHSEKQTFNILHPHDSFKFNSTEVTLFFLQTKGFMKTNTKQALKYLKSFYTLIHKQQIQQAQAQMVVECYNYHSNDVISLLHFII